MSQSENQLEKIALLLEKLLEQQTNKKTNWSTKREEIASRLAAIEPQLDSAKADIAAQWEQRQTAAKEQRERLESRYQDQVVYQERLLSLLAEQTTLLREILEKL